MARLFAAKSFTKATAASQIGFCHGVGYVGIHALCRTAAQRQRFDLRDVAPDNGEGDLMHQLHGCAGTQSRSTGAYRIQQDRVSQVCGLPAGPVHSLNAPLIQSTDVDVQPAANGSDVLHILRLIGHDRAAAAGQQDVGHIVHRYIVGDVVNQRRGLPHTIKTVSQHKITPPKGKCGYACKDISALRS